MDTAAITNQSIIHVMHSNIYIGSWLTLPLQADSSDDI